ncbi:MerR family transcriptional regulator [Dactylosporangium siamense]|uniref:MerR family transcriptional regulator n=1 Tax=Dactylosporangium siamense TaxID=685454 RepID=A0A919PHR0_9ACTN|nr:MerR family transcriptional regulator [Dactylosporangium siamense]GIG43879.1 MerR family transcriptional regulator [Dactylosporangium siamense]
MRIGELARAAGVTTRTLRHYEAEGLLHSERSGNGYRSYPDGAVLRVNNIRELLAIGFTVADVRCFVRFLDQPLPPAFGDQGGCATAMRVARERVDQLRDRISALTTLHDALTARMPS